jgi:hypothetical protein
LPAYVLEADLELADDCDPRSVGAAVTLELCGSYEHDGPCTWPHNNEIDASRTPSLFRTLYVADDDEEPEVRERIEQSLRRAGTWQVADVRSRPVSNDERDLADRLASGPRRIR